MATASSIIYPPGVTFDPVTRQPLNYSGGAQELVQVDGAWQRVPYGYSAEEYKSMSPEQRLQARMLAEATYTRDSNRSAVEGAIGLSGASSAATNDTVNQLTWDRLGNQQELVAAAQAGDQQALAALGLSGAMANQSDQAIIDAQRGFFGGATQADQQSVSQLAGSGGLVGGLQDQNLRQYGRDLYSAQTADQRLGQQLAQRAESFPTLQAAQWGRDLSSRAGAATADSGAVQAQQQALGEFRQVGQGALDQQSALSDAYADEDAISAQRDALGLFADNARKSTNLRSAAEGITPDQRAVDSQFRYLDQYEADSNPAISATERYMLEGNRRDEERQRKAAMDARIRDLQARGMMGAGEELGAASAAFSTAAQTRSMQDLQALANAQQRAERARAQGTALAGDLRAQGFGEQMDVAGAQDAMARAGLGAETAAISAYSNAAGNMRGQSFDEAASRAGGVDAFAAANANRRLAGLGSYADLASGMRGSSFGEQYQAGSAADQIAQFNRSGSIAQQNYNTALQQQQQNDQWGRYAQATGVQLGVNDAGAQRAGDYFSAAQGNAADQYGRAQDLYAAQTGATDNAYTRSENLANAGYDANQAGYVRNAGYAAAAQNTSDAQYGRGADANAQYGQAIDDFYNRQRDSQGDLMNYTSLYTGQGRADSGNVNDQLKLQLGGLEAKKAQDQIDEENKFNILKPGTWF